MTGRLSMETMMNIGALTVLIFLSKPKVQIDVSSTTGDYWAFGLPTTLNNIDNFLSDRQSQ